MKSLKVVPLMVVAFINLWGCSDPSERILTKAPQSEDELGYLIAGATFDEKNSFFQANSHIQIREISNENIIIFEALNSDYKTLKENFPNSRIFKNELIPYTNKVVKPMNMNQILSFGESVLTNTSPSFNLNACKNESLKPIAKMTPLSANLSNPKPLEVGENIKLTSSQSQPHAFIGGAINTAWIIQAPQGSFIPELTFSKDLDLVLDTMGYYQIYLVVQDQKMNCQFENIGISVTGNKPYLGATLANLDQQISQQTYIKKLGLEKAHKTSTGKGILIAVVDSGVNYNNPYLAPNIFINTAEVPDNNIDDDKNGHVDDVYGWDFVFNDKYPYDDFGHGSHVSGLAAAKVFGVAPDAKILPIKAGNNSGMLDIGTTFKAVIYALKMNADIINLSLGGERPIFKEELELYKMALNKDTLIIAAAGNGEPSKMGIFLGVDIDNRTFAPAGVDLENILSVGALNNNDNLAYYSNYGVKKINVATYGGEDFDLATQRPYAGQMFSTYIENAKGDLFFGAQGTSMATPVAAGIAALVRSANPNLTAGQTTRLLESVGSQTTSLVGKIKSGRILTADGAVELAKPSTTLLN